jgi:hypothetical protein
MTDECSKMLLEPESQKDPAAKTLTKRVRRAGPLSLAKRRILITVIEYSEKRNHASSSGRKLVTLGLGFSD